MFWVRELGRERKKERGRERERKEGKGERKLERERGREGFLSPMFSYLGGVIDFIDFVGLALEGDTLIAELGIWRN